MFDTLRFQIKVEPDIFARVKAQCNAHVEIEPNNNDRIKVHTKKIPLGSYDYNINVSIYQEDIIYLEFSAPKVYFGHNVYLLYCSKVVEVLLMVHTQLENTFNLELPSIYDWQLQRLDICYAWKFASQKQAYLALLILEPYGKKDENKLSYSTSTQSDFTNYKVKFYMKHDEYRKHDYRELKKRGYNNVAEDMLFNSVGVLRFEITLRKKELVKHFKKNPQWKEILKDSVIYDLLNQYLNAYVKNAGTNVVKYNEVLIKLLSTFKKTKAMNLLEFYNAWYHPNPSKRAFNRTTFKKNRNRSTIYRKVKDLGIAKIGIENQSYQFTFKYEIPSPCVVNGNVASIAEAMESPLAELRKEDYSNEVKVESEANLDDTQEVMTQQRSE